MTTYLPTRTREKRQQGDAEEGDDDGHWERRASAESAPPHLFLGRYIISASVTVHYIE